MNFWVPNQNVIGRAEASTAATNDNNNINNNSNFFNTIFVSSHMYLCRPTQEPRRDPRNRRLNEHGIYIRHCQESNSQLVPS